MEGSGVGGPDAPPSPLSGAYLLIVIGEPHSSLHRQQILTKVQNGFLSWDKESCHVDLEKELQTLASQSPDGEESKNGERLIQYASENLVTEVLIHPTLNTLTQCVRNLLSSFTRHRHIIHAGYTFAGNGSWIVQDGTFSLADLMDAFQETDVLRVLRAYENTVSVDVHCAPEADWSTARMRRESFSKLCCVRINPEPSLGPAKNVDEFMAFVGRHLLEADLEQLLEPSDVVGNIRFSHPTLYVFPGGQGDAALFGINGFNMLVDGGFSRRACFWDFTRHLDRLDAVLVTRLNNANCLGIAAVLRRKRHAHVYPQIGHFFCNLQERRQQQSPDCEKEGDSLLVNLADIGQEMVVNCRQLQLKPHVCHRDVNIEPINLYHKVGHGKLDMYVISPAKDSRDLKEFLAKWHANDQALFSGLSKKKGEFQFPLHNLVSICAMLVWQPANPNETITRLLFPGSTPQHKIFEGLEKLKHLEFLKHSVCSAKTLSPSSSTIGMTTKTASGTAKPKPASAVIDKLLPGEGLSKPTSRTISTVESVNKQNIAKSATIPVAAPILSEGKQKAAAQKAAKKIEKQATVDRRPSKEKTELEKEKDVMDKKDDEGKDKETEITETDAKVVSVPSKPAVEKPIVKVDVKSKGEAKSGAAKPVKSKIDSRPSVERPKPERKPSKQQSVEKKTDSVKSSPTTPKKTIESKPKVTAAKATSRTRASPTTTPAKSAKEENNRKVVESKKTTAAKQATATKPPKKEVSKTEKRPPRKSLAASPSKAAPKTDTSPKKAVSRVGRGKGKKETTKKDKIEPDRAIVTDSSTVSTPSTADVEIPALKASIGGVEKCVDGPEKSITTDKGEVKRDVEVIDDAEKLEDEGIEKDVESTDKGDMSDDVDLKVVKGELVMEKSADGEELGDEKFIKETVGDVKEGVNTISTEKDESERDEEDEILVIEKVELDGYDNSAQEPESLESHGVEEIEDELQKHLRDETESEKKLKKDDDCLLDEQDKKKDAQVEEDKEDEGAIVDGSLEYEEEEGDKEKIVIGDDEKEENSNIGEGKEIGEMKRPTPDSLNLKDQSAQSIGILSPEDKEKIVEEVQGIIISATEFVTKTKLEAKDVQSDDQRSSEVKGSQESGSDKNIPKPDDKKDDSDEMREKSKDQGDSKYVAAEESQPDEKLSTTIESGATTAPTLPEDERIPLDEIKEGIEEKYVKEETKEKDVIDTLQNKVEQPTSLPQIAVAGSRAFGSKAQIPRDIVKTPDEVADLPVHEEVDVEMYMSEEYTSKESQQTKDDLLDVCAIKKSTDVKGNKDLNLHEDEVLVDSNVAEEDECKKMEMTEEEPIEEGTKEFLETSSRVTEETRVGDLKSQDKNSTLEEQIIHSTLKAPEVPEYVMLSPDSAPESPLPKDETKGILKDSKIYKETVCEEKELDTAEKDLHKLESDVKGKKKEQLDPLDVKASNIQVGISTSIGILDIGEKEILVQEPDVCSKSKSPESRTSELGGEPIEDDRDVLIDRLLKSDTVTKKEESEQYKELEKMKMSPTASSESKTNENKYEQIKSSEKHDDLDNMIQSEKKTDYDQQDQSIVMEEQRAEKEKVDIAKSVIEETSSEPTSKDQKEALVIKSTVLDGELSTKSPSPTSSILKSSKSASPEPIEKGILEPSEKCTSPCPSELAGKTAAFGSPTPLELERSRTASPEVQIKGSGEESSLKTSSPPSTGERGQTVTTISEIEKEFQDNTKSTFPSENLAILMSATSKPGDMVCQLPKSVSPECLEKEASTKSASPEPRDLPFSTKSASPLPGGYDSTMELSEKEKKFLPEKSLSPTPSEAKIFKPSSPEPKDKDVSSAKSASPVTFEEKTSELSGFTKQYEEAIGKFEDDQLLESSVPFESVDSGKIEERLKGETSAEPSSPEPASKPILVESINSPLMENRTSKSLGLDDESTHAKSIDSDHKSEFDYLEDEKHGETESNLILSKASQESAGQPRDKAEEFEPKISHSSSPEPADGGISAKSVSPTLPDLKSSKPASPEPTDESPSKKVSGASSEPKTSISESPDLKDKSVAKSSSPTPSLSGTSKTGSPEPFVTESLTPAPSDRKITEPGSQDLKVELTAKSDSPAPSTAKTSKSVSPEPADVSAEANSSAESEIIGSKPGTPDFKEKSASKSVSPVLPEQKISETGSTKPINTSVTKSPSPTPTDIKSEKPGSPNLRDVPALESVSPVPLETILSKTDSPVPTDISCVSKSMSPAPSEARISKPGSPDFKDKHVAISTTSAPLENVPSKPEIPVTADVSSVLSFVSSTPSEAGTSEPGSPDHKDELVAISQTQALSEDVQSKPKSQDLKDVIKSELCSPAPLMTEVCMPGSPSLIDKSATTSDSSARSDIKTSKPELPDLRNREAAELVSQVRIDPIAMKPGSPEPRDQSVIEKVSPAPSEPEASESASPEPTDVPNTAKAMSPAPSEPTRSKPGSPEPTDVSTTAKSLSPAPSEPKTSKPVSPDPTDVSTTAKLSSSATSEPKTSKPVSPEPTDFSTTAKSTSPAPSEPKTSKPVSPEPTDISTTAKSSSSATSEPETLKPVSPEPTDIPTGAKSLSPAKTSKPVSPELTDIPTTAESLSPAPSEPKTSKPVSPEPTDISTTAKSSSAAETSKPVSPEPTDISTTAKSLGPATSEPETSKPVSPEPTDISTTAKSLSPAPSEPKTSKPVSPEPTDIPTTAKSLSPAPSEPKTSKPVSPDPTNIPTTAKAMSPAPSEPTRSKPGSPEPKDVPAKSSSPAPSEPRTSKPVSPEPTDVSITAKSLSPAPSEPKTSKPVSPEPTDVSVTAKSLSPAPSEPKTSKSVSPEPTEFPTTAKSMSPAPSEPETSKPVSPEPTDITTPAKSSSPATSEPKTSKPVSPEPTDFSTTAKSMSPAPSEHKTSKPVLPEPTDVSTAAKSSSPAPSEFETSKPVSPEPTDITTTAKSSSPDLSEPKTSKAVSSEPIDASTSAKLLSPEPLESKTSKLVSPEPTDVLTTAKSSSPAPSEPNTSKPGSPDLVDELAAKSFSHEEASKSTYQGPVDSLLLAKSESVSPSPVEIKTPKSITPEPYGNRSSSSSLLDRGDEPKLEQIELFPKQNDLIDSADEKSLFLDEKNSGINQESASKVPTRSTSPESIIGGKLESLEDNKESIASKIDEMYKDSKESVVSKMDEVYKGKNPNESSIILQDFSSVICGSQINTGEVSENETVPQVLTKDEQEISGFPECKRGEKDSSVSNLSSSPTPIELITSKILEGKAPADEIFFSHDESSKESTKSLDLNSQFHDQSSMDLAGGSIQKLSLHKEIETKKTGLSESSLDRALLESSGEKSNRNETEKEIVDLSLTGKSSTAFDKISSKSVSPTTLEIENKIGLGDDYNKIKPLTSSTSHTPRSISPLPRYEIDGRADLMGTSDHLMSSSAVGKDIFLKDTRIDDIEPFSTDKTDVIESTMELIGDTGSSKNGIGARVEGLESNASIIEFGKTPKTTFQETSASDSLLSIKSDHSRSSSPASSLKETIDKKDLPSDSKVSSKSVSPVPSEVDSKMDEWMKSLGRKDLDSKISSTIGSKTETPKSISPVLSDKFDLKTISTPPPSPKLLESTSNVIADLESKVSPPKSPELGVPLGSTVMDSQNIFEKVTSMTSSSPTPCGISGSSTSTTAPPSNQVISSVNGFSNTLDSLTGIKLSMTDGIVSKDSSAGSSKMSTKSAIDESALPITDKYGESNLLTDTTSSSTVSTKSDSCVPNDSVLKSEEMKIIASASESVKLPSDSQLMRGESSVGMSEESSQFSSNDCKEELKGSEKSGLFGGLSKMISEAVEGVETAVTSTVDLVLSKTAEHVSKPVTSEKLDDESVDESSKTVRRMVVTASSEDGGNETELCAGGSISFTPKDTKVSEDTKDAYIATDIKYAKDDRNTKDVEYAINSKVTKNDKDNKYTTQETSLDAGKDDASGISSECQIITKTLGNEDGGVTTLTTVIKPSTEDVKVIEKAMTELPGKSSTQKGNVEDVCFKKNVADEVTKKEPINISSHAFKPLAADSKFLSGVVGELKKEAFDITRSGTPGSEPDFDGGISSPRSDISSGQASRALTGSEEHLDSRSSPDSPGSPCLAGPFGSMTGSIIGSFKPYAMQFGGVEHGDDYKISQILDDDDNEHKSITEMITTSGLVGKQPPEKLGSLIPKDSVTNGQSSTITSGQSINVTGKVEEPSASGESPKAREKDSKVSSSATTSSTSSSLPQSAADLTSDPIKGWGKPLGLPPPPEEKNRWFPTWDPIEEWGKPLGLPTPAPPLVKKDSLEDMETTSTSNKTTPKKVAKKNAENNKSASNTNMGKEANTKSKRPESPNKRGTNKENRRSGSYIYVDLSYVPHNGNSYYSNVEFFKRIRARYYVFSGTEPSREVFNALLEAKQTWDDKDLEVTIIPTYDTDVLGYWVAENEEVLAKNKIDLSPSASRCTINLQDHETSCSAYRLEF